MTVESDEQGDPRLDPVRVAQARLQIAERNVAEARRERNRLVYGTFKRYGEAKKNPVTVADLARATGVRHSYARRVVLGKGKPASGGST